MMKKEIKKRNYLIIILIVIIIFLGGLCTFFYLKNEFAEEKYEDLIINNIPLKSENENLISKEAALQIVLDNLNIQEKDIYDLNWELEYKYNTYVYEIDFNYHNYEYDYYVNAKTSEIIKAFRERD